MKEACGKISVVISVVFNIAVKLKYKGGCGVG